MLNLRETAIKQLFLLSIGHDMAVWLGNCSMVVWRISADKYSYKIGGYRRNSVSLAQVIYTVNRHATGSNS